MNEVHERSKRGKVFSGPFSECTSSGMDERCLDESFGSFSEERTFVFTLLICCATLSYIGYLMQDDNIIKTTEEEVVVEGEVTETTEETSPMSATDNAATVSLSLENLIRGHLGTLEKLKTQIAEQTDMLNNVLTNDATYKQHEEEAKKATKVKTATKAEIMKRPDVMQVSNKIKAAREEMKEQQQTLSELLAEYLRTTGLDSIELEDGKIKKIVTTAKLVS